MLIETLNKKISNLCEALVLTGLPAFRCSDRSSSRLGLVLMLGACLVDSAAAILVDLVLPDLCVISVSLRFLVLVQFGGLGHYLSQIGCASVYARRLLCATRDTGAEMVPCL